MAMPDSRANAGSQPDRRRTYETTSTEEFRDAILAMCGARRVEIGAGDDFTARGCVVSLSEIELRYGTCSTSVGIDFPPIDCFRVALPLSGTGRITNQGDSFPVDGRHACITPPDLPSRMEFGSAHGWLTLRVKPSALARRAMALTGRRPRGPFEFPASMDLDAADGRLLSGLALLLANTLSAGQPPDGLIIAGLEDVLVQALLSLSRWNDGNPSPPSAGNAAARLAAEYIDANCIERHVDLAELVALTQVSARSLSRAFVRIYGSSPIAYAKQKRLSHARDLLQHPTVATTVTAVAFRCGFANLSHFAKDYGVLFGELPSQTLAAAKRRTG